jgi:predicted DNA-binding transcriptional regulator AlpA
MSEPLYPPRGMSRAEAARWVGVSASKFDQLVKDGRMPRPRAIDGRVIWDRYQLDAAIDELPDRDRAANDDDWKVAV